MNVDANSLGEMLDLDAAAALDASSIQISFSLEIMAACDLFLWLSSSGSLVRRAAVSVLDA